MIGFIIGLIIALTLGIIVAILECVSEQKKHEREQAHMRELQMRGSKTNDDDANFSQVS